MSAELEIISLDMLVNGKSYVAIEKRPFQGDPKVITFTLRETGRRLVGGYDPVVERYALTTCGTFIDEFSYNFFEERICQC